MTSGAPRDVPADLGVSTARDAPADLVVSSIFSVVALFAVVEALRLVSLGGGATATQSAAAFPMVISLALGALCVWSLAAALVSRRRGRRAPERIRLGAWPVLAVIVATVVLLPIGGFLLVMPVAVAALLALLGERRWRTVIAPFAVVSVAVTYLLFREVFSIRLPLGPLAAALG